MMKKVPQGWEIEKLGDLGRVLTGKTPLKAVPEFWDSKDISFYKPDDFSKNDITDLYDGKDYISNTAFVKAVKAPINSVLITCIGIIGKVAITKKECSFNQQINAVVPDDRINYKFLAYSIIRLKEILQQQANAAVVPMINKSEFSKTPIIFPPLPQQEKIVSVLDTASALVEKQKSLLTKYDLFLKSKFIEMFGDPVKNPMGWKISPISEVCSDIVDCVNRTAEIVDYITPYKMIRTTNVRNHRISLKDARCVEEDIYKTWIRRLKPQRGDLVFTREAPVGEAGIIDFDDEVFLGQRTMLFRPDTSLTNPYYLLFEMMGENLKYQMDKISAGSVVKHLSVPDCKKFTIHRPPISLQNQFAKIVEQTETLKQKEQQKLEKLQTLYDALMKRAFDGEIV